MARQSKYPEEFRRQAAALVLDSGATIRDVGRELGVHHETLRNWVAQLRQERDSGRPSDLAADERPPPVARGPGPPARPDRRRDRRASRVRAGRATDPQHPGTCLPRVAGSPSVVVVEGFMPVKGALQVERLLTLFFEFGLGVCEVEGGRRRCTRPLDAEQFGQASFEVVDAPLWCAGVFVQVGVVGEQGSAAGYMVCGRVLAAVEWAPAATSRSAVCEWSPRSAQSSGE
ncbi:transposase [Micromonospora psammae]|uniref:transposase n=1 Tax=Micromonospora sp. CPCC 205556 TaxID=3122398 RepID=UPI003FA5A398